MVGDEPLRDEVELVEAHVLVIASRWNTSEGAAAARDAHLDDERPARLEMRGGVREARDLSLLRRQVEDRVEDDVDERERPVDLRRRHVADRDLDLVRLLPQLRDHVRREVDARDPNAACGERHGDPAGADRELERPATGEGLEEVDDRLDRHAGRRLVVALCDVACEPVGHPDRFSFPCFFAYRSPTLKIARPIGVASTAMISSGQTFAHGEPGAFHDRRAAAAQRVRRRRDLRDPLHPLRHDADRVVDARDDEHQALRDEAELRALLRRDQRQHRGHDPDADEGDGREREQRECRTVVRVRRVEAEERATTRRTGSSRGSGRTAPRRRPARTGARAATAAP